MKSFFKRITKLELSEKYLDIAILFFRIMVSVELIVVHGFKKIGIGVEIAETIPNPLGFPDSINQFLATIANIVFPVFIIFGLFTRIAVLPILAVTLTGYLLLHAHDPLLVKDVPFMYSTVFMLILILGPGKYSLDHFIYKKLSK